MSEKLIQNLSLLMIRLENCGTFHSHYHRHFTQCSKNATEKHAYTHAASRTHLIWGMLPCTDNKGSISSLPCAAGWLPAHVLTSIFTFHTCKHQRHAGACQHTSTTPVSLAPRGLGGLFVRDQNFRRVNEKCIQLPWSVQSISSTAHLKTSQWKEFLLRSR